MTDYTRRILSLSATIHRWLSALLDLESSEREKVARYADEIASTLARAAAAIATLEHEPGNRTASLAAMREIGRITGYVETIVELLDTRLDGRKLAGVKRRLDRLMLSDGIEASKPPWTAARAEHLSEAEGYFRALADGLRT